MHSLEEVNERLRVSENTIIQLGNDKVSLIAGKKQCEADLSTLRCDANRYLENVRQSQKTSDEKLLQVNGYFDLAKSSIKKFIIDKKLTCPKA